MKSLNIEDHSLTTLAEMGKKDVIYSRMMAHLERGDSLEDIRRGL